MNIRAVVFDAVGTVMYPSPPMANVYQDAIAKHCGMQLDVERIRQTVNSALSQRGLSPDLTTDESREHQFWQDVIKELCGDHEARQACFDDLYNRFQHPESWSCFEDVPECINRLLADDVTMAIASNFDSRLHPVLDGLAPLSPIPHRFVSSEIGWRKPAQHFFQHVCDQLQLHPASILFVGDGLTNDVLGAHQAGCRSVWIRRGKAAAKSAPAGTLVVTSLTTIPSIAQENQL